MSSVAFMTDLANLDATAQAELVRNRDAQPIELVDAAIARIEALNDELNPVIHPLIDPSRALATGVLPIGPYPVVLAFVKILEATTAIAQCRGGQSVPQPLLL